MTSAEAPMSQAASDRGERSGWATAMVEAGERRVNGADGTTVCRSSSARNARYAERTAPSAARRSASSTAAGVPSKHTKP